MIHTKGCTPDWGRFFPGGKDCCRIVVGKRRGGTEVFLGVSNALLSYMVGKICHFRSFEYVKSFMIDLKRVT